MSTQSQHSPVRFGHKPRHRMLAVGATVIIAGLGMGDSALAASVTVIAAHLATTSVATPLFLPSSLQLPNGGPTVGKAETGDQIVVVFSQQVRQSTLCSSWANTSNTQSQTGVTLTLADNAGATGNDTLAITAAPATCSGGFHFGTVDLGSNAYVLGGNTTFTNTKIALSQTPTTTTITVTLGTPGGAGTLRQVRVGSAAVYTPVASLKDVIGRAISASTATSATTVQL